MDTNRIARLTNDWSRIAGETLRIENTADWVYAYGSELACLRLYYSLKTGVVEKRGSEFVYFKGIQS